MVGDNLRVIEARDVSYVYPDGSIGVEDVTLNVESGERIVLLGANGSGKSTLIFLLAGLLQPSKGEVKIFGMKPEKRNLEEIRRRIGVVFQNPDDFLFNPTVRDELAYVPRQLGWSEAEILKSIEEYSELFGIQNLLNKPPFRLSGGEKKKVEIASVLIYEPEVLLLDEPTANVDGKTRRLIIEMLQRYEGTLIIATHEVDLAKRLAERVVVLNLNHRVEVNGEKDILEDVELLERVGVL